MSTARGGAKMESLFVAFSVTAGICIGAVISAYSAPARKPAPRRSYDGVGGTA